MQITKIRGNEYSYAQQSKMTPEHGSYCLTSVGVPIFTVLP